MLLQSIRPCGSILIYLKKDGGHATITQKIPLEIVKALVPQIVDSSFVVAAASQVSEFSEVDVTNMVMTGQRKLDAEPKRNSKSQKVHTNIDKNT